MRQIGKFIRFQFVRFLTQTVQSVMLENSLVVANKCKKTSFLFCQRAVLFVVCFLCQNMKNKRKY